ncbi:hypothetical protein Tco_0138925 [Tanacetum coccineum]
MEDKIFFNQSKYIKEILKKFRLEDSKPIKTPMSTETKLTKYDKGEFVDSTKNLSFIMPTSNQTDYKRIKEYLRRIHHSKTMPHKLRDKYIDLEDRLFQEGRIVEPSFINAHKLHPLFSAMGLESLLTLNEQVCPRLIIEFYHSLELKRDGVEVI